MRHRFLSLLLVSLAIPSPVVAQGIFEGQAIRGLSAGMGSGVAASLGNGKVVQRSYEKMAQAQQAGIALTKAINDYISFGNGYEKKKDWFQADKCFRYVLQLVARRDGPGSKNSVPILQHLVHVNKEQNKLDDAISFQKTFLAFARSAKQPDNKVILQAQQELSGFYIQKHDYANAEPLLKTSIALADGAGFVAPEVRLALKKQYASVLRELNREQEAVSIENALAAEAAASKVESAPHASAAPAPAKSAPSAAAAPVVRASAPSISPPVASVAPIVVPAAVGASTPSAAAPAAVISAPAIVEPAATVMEPSAVVPVPNTFAPSVPVPAVDAGAVQPGLSVSPVVIDPAPTASPVVPMTGGESAGAVVAPIMPATVLPGSSEPLAPANNPAAGDTVSK